MLPNNFDRRYITQYGDPEKLFFLPFIGEFGCYLTTYVHDIYRIEAKEKVVAIRPLHKVLFPTATELFYDWDLFVDDIRRDGTNRTRGPKRFMRNMMNRIIKEYPKYKDYTFTSPFFSYNSRCLPYSGFDLERLTAIEDKVDFCICTRNRLKKAEKKNLSREYWEELLSHFPKYKVANVGEKDTSLQDLKGVTYNSWDYHYSLFDVNCSINLIQNSKVVITTNTGGLHLANLCGSDIIIIWSNRGMLAHVQTIKKNNRIILIHQKNIKDIDFVAKVIKAYFKYPDTKLIGTGLTDWSDYEKTIDLERT